MAARSIAGAPKLTPWAAIAAASSMVLATCSSAFEGMQPTLRQTPPSVGRAVDQHDLLPEVGGAEGGGVAAGTGAEHEDVRLEVGRTGRSRRRAPARSGGGSAGAAAGGRGGRRGAAAWAAPPLA